MYRDGFSMHGADRYIAEELLMGKTNGFFVDVGSGDGLPPSNTLLLELCYGCEILREPLRHVTVFANPARAAETHYHLCLCS